MLLLTIANITLLILHEIESAYEREWELLKLPGQITGFLWIHVPVLLVFLFGLVEVSRNTMLGTYIACLIGISGILPLVVHRVLKPCAAHFQRNISIGIMVLNAGLGVILAMCSVMTLFK